jgi:hypothetical protein
VADVGTKEFALQRLASILAYIALIPNPGEQFSIRHAAWGHQW